MTGGRYRGGGYLEEGQVMVLLGVGDLQVLQHHRAVAVDLLHVLVVGHGRAQQREFIARALAYCSGQRTLLRRSAIVSFEFLQGQARSHGNAGAEVKTAVIHWRAGLCPERLTSSARLVYVGSVFHTPYPNRNNRPLNHSESDTVFPRSVHLFPQ